MLLWRVMTRSTSGKYNQRGKTSCCGAESTLLMSLEGPAYLGMGRLVSLFSLLNYQCPELQPQEYLGTGQPVPEV